MYYAMQAWHVLAAIGCTEMFHMGMVSAMEGLVVYVIFLLGDLADAEPSAPSKVSREADK